MTYVAGTGKPGAGVDLFLARYAALRERLPGDRAARDAAADAFSVAGLPGPRLEAWKYTNLRGLAEIADATGTSPAEPSDLPDGARLVFVDGAFRADLSAASQTFAQAPLFPAAHGEPIALLNTMLASDGAVLDIAGDAGTLNLLSIGNASAHLRHRIRMAPGARLVLIERSRFAAGLHDTLFDIEVAAGAHLTHVRLIQDGDEAFHLATVYAEVEGEGTYDAFVLTAGAKLARTEIHTRLGGPRAMAHLNGAQLLSGTRVGDVTTVVRHDAPNCASRQTVKTVATDRARGVFQGIEVARPAQKTDGYQMSQALLLSPEAEVDFKPQLEIYADDVKCSHGATVGQLDENQLFYLRSRGVPEPEARGMLVRAFMTEALDGVQDEGARAVLQDVVEAWWAKAA
jgi:Fe-S cluster assembly protein SufD